MSFFDDKQDILKVELTTYGRYLISRGKFKPAYYAFFDDDVLYDGEYADLSETQNGIQTRILDETLSLKPQTTFTSIENNVKLSTLLQREVGKIKQEQAQISADKNYALSYPLAKSSHSSEYAPAWALQFINGTISGNVEQYINNASGTYDILQPFLKLPQINLQESIYDIKRKLNDETTEGGYNLVYTFISGNDNYAYSMTEPYILIDLRELNVDDNNKNFDIELFVEDEEIIPGTDTKRKILNKLNFKKQTIDILNGILLDEPITFDVTPDSTFAEYHFDITIDDEIELPSQQFGVGAVPAYSQNTNAASGVKGNKGPFGGVDC